MTDGWAGLVHRRLHDTKCTDNFLTRASTPPLLDEANVVSAIDSSDIVAAIKKCKHGNASGPEELGNRFYKVFSRQLAPILAEFTPDGLSVE